MACGVCLGILLICLVQAEHVSCLWSSQARGPDGYRYVGFSQQDGRLRRLDGSYPQNQFRQAYFSPRSLNAQSAASGSYSQGPSIANGVQSVPLSSHKPLKIVKSSLFAKPDQQTINWEKVNAPKVPKKEPFKLSYAVSGSYVSKAGNKKASQRPPAVNGRRDSYSFRPPSAAGPKPYSTPFGPRPFGGNIASAFSVGRRVSGRAKSNPFNLWSSFPQVHSRGLPGGQSRPPFQQSSQSFKPNTGNELQASGRKGYAQTRAFNIPDRFGGFAIRRLKDPKSPSEKVVQKPLWKAVTLPPQMPTLRPHVQRGQPDTEWRRLRLLQRG